MTTPKNNEGSKVESAEENTEGQSGQQIPKYILTAAEKEAFELAEKRYNTIKSLVKENVAAAHAYTDALKQNETALRSQIKELLPYNEQLSFYADNLENSIKLTQKLSNTLKEELERSIKESAERSAQLSTAILKLNEIAPNTIETFVGLEAASGKLNSELHELNKVFDDDTFIIEEINKAIGDRIELTEEELRQNVARIASLKDGVNAEQAEAAVRNVILATIAKNIEFRRQENQELDETALKLRREQQELLTLYDLKKKQEEGTLAVNKAMNGLIDKYALGSSSSNLMTKAVYSLSSGFGNLSKSIGTGLWEGFMNFENASNRFFNFLHKNMIASTFEFDANLSAINKSTGGMGKEFEKVAMNTGKVFSASAINNMATYGVGIKEAGAAYGALANKMNNFNNMGDEQRKILMLDAAAMENLGISAGNYANITSTLMGSMQKTAEGARREIRALANDAIAAGRDVGQYAKEFEQILPKISGYGREAKEIFKSLNAFAAATKGVMSTSDLQTFADQFNNWDQAAESVSKLNAALGGTSVNIEDLMRADPTEKLMLLKRTFDESGKKFDDLNIGYKRLLAETFGGDVNKAASFFNASSAEAYSMMKKTAAEEKEREERMKKSVAAQEKLNKAIDSMKIALTPVINFVAEIADGLAAISASMGGFGGLIVGAIVLAIPLAIGAFKMFSLSAKLSMVETIQSVTVAIGELTAAINNAKNQAAQIPNAAATGVVAPSINPAAAGTENALLNRITRGGAPGTEAAVNPAANMPTNQVVQNAAKPGMFSRMGSGLKTSMTTGFGASATSMAGGMAGAAIATGLTNYAVNSFRTKETEEKKKKFTQYEIASGAYKAYKDVGDSFDQVTGVKHATLDFGDGTVVGVNPSPTDITSLRNTDPNMEKNKASSNAPKLASASPSVNVGGSGNQTKPPVINNTVQLGDFNGTLVAKLDVNDSAFRDAMKKMFEEMIGSQNRKGVPA